MESESPEVQREAEVQRADPRLRVRVLLCMMLVAALGAAAILYLDAYLTELHTLVFEAKPEALDRARHAVFALLALIAAGGALFSLYLGRISWRTLRSERYPPPGTRVISDTEVHRGLEARRRGQAGLVLAALTLVLTMTIVSRAHRAFDQMLSPPLKPTQLDQIESLPIR